VASLEGIRWYAQGGGGGDESGTAGAIRGVDTKRKRGRTGGGRGSKGGSGAKEMLTQFSSEEGGGGKGAEKGTGGARGTAGVQGNWGNTTHGKPQRDQTQEELTGGTGATGRSATGQLTQGARTRGSGKEGGGCGKERVYGGGGDILHAAQHPIHHITQQITVCAHTGHNRQTVTHRSTTGAQSASNSNQSPAI